MHVRAKTIIIKWKKFGTTKTLPRAGRPAKLSFQGRRSLDREVIKNPMVTLTELLSSSVEIIVLLEGSPISTEELELCHSDHWVLGHLSYQGPSPLIAQVGLAAGTRKSLGGSKLLPFKNDGGHCVLGNLE